MANANLITLLQPRSAAAEAYRSLRTNLMFSSVEDPISYTARDFRCSRRRKKPNAGEFGRDLRARRQQNNPG